jgi:hypothetical protein
LAVGQILRFVRSSSLVVKPGPAYPFPAGMTVAALAIVANSPSETPIPGAVARVRKVNGVIPAEATVGGVKLKHVTLPAPSGSKLVLGVAADLETSSDARGRAVFYYPGNWALTSLEVEVSHPGHAIKTMTVALTPGQRRPATIKLVPA